MDLWHVCCRWPCCRRVRKWLCRRMAALAQKVRGIDADVVIDGHWKPYTKEEYMAEIG